MVCPMCVTAAIVANAPGIMAAVGGIAAAKVAVQAHHKNPKALLPDTRPGCNSDTPIARVVVALKGASPELQQSLTALKSTECWTTTGPPFVLHSTVPMRWTCTDLVRQHAMCVIACSLQEAAWPAGSQDAACVLRAVCCC